MTKLKWMAGAVLAVFAAGAAEAADMPVYYEQPAQAEFGGWYLRGDIGMSHQISDDIDSPFFDIIDPADTLEILKSEWDPSWFVGAGFGYQFNEHFRMDVTGEYRGGSDFTGHDYYDTGSDGTIDGTNDYTGKKEEAVFLVNAYYDFAGFSSWATPYIGAGVGAAWIKLSDFRDVNAMTGALGLSGDTETWNIAAALYAGVGFQLSERLMLDVGYRFLYMGDASTEDLVALDGSNATYNPLRFNNIMSHDVRVGLRYGF